MVPLYTASAATARLFLRTVILSLQNRPHAKKKIQTKISKIFPSTNSKFSPHQSVSNFLVVITDRKPLRILITKPKKTHRGAPGSQLSYEPGSWVVVLRL
jgi:hypothetical protein